MANFTQGGDIERLMSILQRGKDNKLKAAEIAVELGYSPEPNQEETRDLIRRAIDAGSLIGSVSGGNAGYWEIATTTELNECLDSLERRADGVCDRRNNLIRNWNIAHPDDETEQVEKEVQS